ncbi:MAG: protein-glutamate O-methyltransferase CheR [Candidatus Heimdallarchaeota archaeon]|nr:MAG: protein-glutamate O-methyltransferase CheR [Candidatus Heimdallarchaeota archaeon]
MRTTKCLTYKQYWILLSEDKKEFSLLKRNFSINVTSFFRDPEVFTLFMELFKIYVREIINRNNLSRIRIWSAGCSNGSEPYSISIILHQILQHKLSYYNVKIHATDINEDTLAIAKTGKYPDSVSKEVSEEYLEQLFIKTSDSHYQIKMSLRNLVKFDSMDLMADSFPFKDLDVIFCRYVSMYFHKSQKELLVRKFYDLLNPGGLLILGGTDRIPVSLQNLFNPLSVKKSIYQKPLSKEQRKMILGSLPPEELFCEWCGKAFVRITDLRLHLEHSQCKLGQFHCYVCKKGLFSKIGLISHLKYSHYVDRNDSISRVFNRIKQS